VRPLPRPPPLSPDRREWKACKLKEDADAKSGKKAKAAVQAVLVVLGRLPREADTDLKRVWEKICEYKQEAYLGELQARACGVRHHEEDDAIVDDPVTTASRRIPPALEEYAQPVTVASMNKV
jgi:hypothetical protein